MKKKSTSTDMTAMCDVAFLLLTFFILTATAKVPDRVTAPVVVEFGVRPVVPAEKELTVVAGVVLAQVVPLDVNRLPDAPGATNVGAEAPFPKITLFAVSVESPVPPSATARSVIPVIVPPLIVAVVIVAAENVAVPVAIVAVSIVAVSIVTAGI